MYPVSYFNLFPGLSQVGKLPVYLPKRGLQWYDCDMIQDISPHRFDNRFIQDKTPAPDSYAFLFSGDDVLLCGKQESEGDCSLPLCADLPSVLHGVALPAPFYLFSIDETDCFYYPLTNEQVAEIRNADLPAPYAFAATTGIRRNRLVPRHIAFVLLTAHHLSRWYLENRYCGSCAHETVHAPDERAMECPACKRRIYPKIMPAVIVAVTNGDEIVLTRYANRPIAYHALVAGFNEIGETFEETVKREVMEEVGLRVKNIRYYKSQPWAIAGDILAGYFCDVDGDPTIRMDDTELKEAEWVKREDVDGQPDDFSLTNEMMMVFKEGREPRS